MSLSIIENSYVISTAVKNRIKYIQDLQEKDFNSPRRFIIMSKTQ